MELINTIIRKNTYGTEVAEVKVIEAYIWNNIRRSKIIKNGTVRESMKGRYRQSSMAHRSPFGAQEEADECI